MCKNILPETPVKDEREQEWEARAVGHCIALTVMEGGGPPGWRGHSEMSASLRRPSQSCPKRRPQRSSPRRAPSSARLPSQLPAGFRAHLGQLSLPSLQTGAEPRLAPAGPTTGGTGGGPGRVIRSSPARQGTSARASVSEHTALKFSAHDVGWKFSTPPTTAWQ